MCQLTILTYRNFFNSDKQKLTRPLLTRPSETLTCLGDHQLFVQPSNVPWTLLNLLAFTDVKLVVL